jgi:chromosome segregation ATPase
MSKISVQLEYEKKHQELQSLVEKEAKKLQDVIDTREAAQLDIRLLAEKKVSLTKVLLDLQNEVQSTKDFLEELKEKNQRFTEEGKKAYDADQAKKIRNKELLEKITTTLNSSVKVASEVGEFIHKEADAREKYLEQRDKAEVSERNYEEAEAKLKREKAEIEAEKKQLDGTKKYISDLYGKVATYIKVMQETVEYVNEALAENGVPMHFNAPKGKVIEVDFDNFNQERTDT